MLFLGFLVVFWTQDNSLADTAARAAPLLSVSNLTFPHSDDSSILR